MINFYSPMCSHCHHLAPDWRRIAKDFEGIVRVGAVNCEDDWRLCRRLNIQAYPTLLYYPKVIIYIFYWLFCLSDVMNSTLCNKE